MTIQVVDVVVMFFLLFFSSFYILYLMYWTILDLQYCTLTFSRPLQVEVFLIFFTLTDRASTISSNKQAGSC